MRKIEMGKSYQTRGEDGKDRYPVRIVCVDGPAHAPVVGIITYPGKAGQEVETWPANGLKVGPEKSMEHHLDLIEVLPDVVFYNVVGPVSANRIEALRLVVDSMRSENRLCAIVKGTFVGGDPNNATFEVIQ